MTDQPTLGGKVGGRIASLVSAATVATKVKTAPHIVATVMKAQDEFFRLVGSEIRNTIGEPLARVADHEDAPAWAKRTFDFLARSHGQWQSFLAQTVAGQALGVGLGDLFTNELTPVIGSIIKTNPNLFLSPDVMAALVAQHKMPPAEARDEAARQGINSQRWSRLLDAASTDPDLGTLLMAHRRGLLTDAQLLDGIRASGLDSKWQSAVFSLTHVPLTADQAADMVQRGILTHDQGKEIAAAEGVNGADFSRMVQASGQALSLQDLLFLYRRKQITRERLEQGIRQGNTRNEWIPEAEMLGVLPMSTSAAIEAAVQNHISEAEARKIASENGLDPAHFQPLLESAGAPLSRTEMTELWNRGEVTQAQVEQALRESRVKDKYIPEVLKLRRYLIPPDTVRMMYERGVVDKAKALSMFADRGIEASDAELYLAMSSNEKMAPNRDLTMSIIRQLYEDRAITHAVAVKSLQDMGYDETEAAQILSISDLQRNQRLLNSAISRVHARYVAHRIDEVSAVTALDQLQVPSDQRDAYIDTWNVERDLNVPTLTVAQAGGAVKKGLITPQDMYDRLIKMGYDNNDATILVLSYIGNQPQG